MYLHLNIRSDRALYLVPYHYYHYHPLSRLGFQLKIHLYISDRACIPAYRPTDQTAFQIPHRAKNAFAV